MASSEKLILGIANYENQKEINENTLKTIEDIQKEIIENLSKELSTISQALETHKSSSDHDSRYYTENEIAEILNAFATTYIGSSAPETSSKYIVWINSSTRLLYYRTSTSSSEWVPISSIWS